MRMLGIARASGALIAALGLAFVGARAQSGPSFSCAHVTSKVSKLICATPSLSKLDRELDGVFQNMKGQPSVDVQALQKDETSWLADLHRKCSDIACIDRMYEARLSALRAESLAAASPAANAETAPFPAPEARWKEAKSYVGNSCTGYFGNKALLAGYSTPPGFLTVAVSGAYVVPLQKDGARFAFLFVTPNNDMSKCRIADVVTLPAAGQANTFLSCSVPDGQSAAPQSIGVGMRHGAEGVVAYWEIDATTSKLSRTPLDLLGWRDKLRCTAPERGD